MPADEIRGPEFDRPPEARLEGVGALVELVAVQGEPRLEPQGVPRRQTDGNDAEPLTSLEQRPPQLGRERGIGHDLDAVLSRVAGPRDATGAAEQRERRDPEGAQLRGQRLDPTQLADEPERTRPLHGDQSRLVAQVFHLDIRWRQSLSARLDVLADLVPIGGVADDEHLGPSPRAARRQVVDNPVVDHPALVVAATRVHGSPDGAARQIVGHQAVDEGQGAAPAHHEAPHVAHIEQSDAAPHGSVLGHHALELNGHLPSGIGHESRPRALVLGEQGRLSKGWVRAHLSPRNLPAVAAQAAPCPAGVQPALIPSPPEMLYGRSMQKRTLGRTGFEISTVSMGCWAIGGSWGRVDDDESMKTLHRALDRGVNFFDTADVYGDGRSERLLARLRKERPEDFVVATKAGRRLDPHVAGGYDKQNLTAFVERSLKNLEVEALDLLQLHCPPTPVYYQPETFQALDDLVRDGKLRYYGVSVEKVEEGLKALEFEGVQSIQVIYNVLRQRPAELLFKEAARRQVGILARVPLASGLLTGKLQANQSFEADDHRNFNRYGAAFDRGETFSGVDYDLALEVVDALRGQVPPGTTMAQWALRWILMDPAVTTTIPGARRPSQVDDNMAAADLPEIPAAVMEKVALLYADKVRPHVHHLW